MNSNVFGGAWLQTSMNEQEEKVIADYLRNDLGCCDEKFHLMMEESRRLFRIIFQHDCANKKSVGVSRSKIIESIKFTVQNILNNEIQNYPWIQDPRLNKNQGSKGSY